MATIDQVIQQIRFALEGLSERNGQHEFEHLCRHFARQRICFNILPATGPVGVGGDQGRDFETFATFIQNLGSDKFAASAEAKRLAFACSLQKDVPSKVRSDVSAILSGKMRPGIIYFFSSRSIPVSTRHQLQTWAQDNHAVHLEIIDREALAEQLSDASIFWIATRYLNVPLEIFPPFPKANSEYEAKKSAWMKVTDPPTRYSDFVELKRCARHALIHSPQDVHFWLGMLERFETSQVDEPVWTQVAYEIIVLTVRQTHSLRGQEDRIRRYFAKAEKFQYPDEVENASAAMAYVVATHRMGEIELVGAEIHQLWLALREKIERGIAHPASPNQLCHWLEVRSHLSFAGGVTRATFPNVDETLSWWLRIAEECPNTTTFPVQQFHDQIFDYMQLLGDHPKFDAVLEKLRPEITKRTGDAALAESHYKRAEQFSNQKQFIRAIRELHAARVKWFVGETLDHSMYCSVLLARSYSRLGLNYAAMYYSLAAGFIVANASNPDMSDHLYECLASAAEAAYNQGHWCLFSGLVEALMTLHMERAPNPTDLGKHVHLQWLAQNLPMAALVTKRLVPSHFEQLMKEIHRWGFADLTEQGMRGGKLPVDDAEFLRVLRENFTGPPFFDAGTHCETVWSALGIQWRVRWENNFDTLKVAGECVAFLQIAIAEYAGCDLDIVPGTLHAEITVTDDLKVTAEQIPDNDVYRWRFCVPRVPATGVEGMDEYSKQMLVCVVEIIRAFSVMESKRFASLVIEERGARVFDHGFFVRRFPELVGYFLPKPGFRHEHRSKIECPISSATWTAVSAHDLAWINSVHPGFDEAAELKRIRIRYDRTLPAARFTLKRLVANNGFQSTLKELRAKGWKDWHVLQAVTNAAASYRARQKLGDDFDEALFKKAFLEELFVAETETSQVVPLQSFSLWELEFTMFMVISDTMNKHMGLDPYQMVPNPNGICEYLRHRWRYWDLDVDHPPVFDGP